MSPKPNSQNGDLKGSSNKMSDKGKEAGLSNDISADFTPIPGSIDKLNNIHGSVMLSNGEVITPRRETEEFVPPDGGWGWVVCFASFWTNGSIFGIINTFGIIYAALIKEFEASAGAENIAFKTAWIGSLQIAMTFFVSPIASILVDRIGIRVTAFIGGFLATTGMLASSFVYTLEVLYLTYGLLVGIGASLVYTPSMVILGHYFKRHLGLVNGFVAFGSAVFTFVLPYGQKALLDNLGLRFTMQAMSGVLATLMLCCLTWKPLFDPRHTELDHYLTSTESMAQRCAGCFKWLSRFCNFSIWRVKGYVVWVIALPICFLGYFIPFVHLVNHTTTVFPESKDKVNIVVMCLGLTSGIARLIFGKVADMPRVNRIRMQQCAFLIMGVVTTCIPFAGSFEGLLAIVLVMGLVDGCMICLLGPIAFDLLGPRGAAQGLGCLLGLMSIPMTAGPPLAGLVFDHTQSYNIAFWAAGAPPIIGGIILFLVPRPVRQNGLAVTEVEAITSMSLENLDTVGQEEDRMYIDKNGGAHVAIWKIRDYDKDSTTTSVPNLSTIHETGRLMKKHRPNVVRQDVDNQSLY